MADDGGGKRPRLEGSGADHSQGKAPQGLLRERLLHPPDPSRPYRLSEAAEKKGGYMSQYAQDRWVDEVFQGRERLFAVESGAYDGEGYSNTLFLELHRSWQCLLVEASPNMQDMLIAKQRKAWVLKGGLSVTGSFNVFDFKLAGSNSGIVSTYSEKHNTKVDGDLENERWWMHGDKGDIVQVPCWPLHEVLAVLDRLVVDYWSLDTEGSELGILQNTRFDLIEVGVLTVEHNREEDRKANINAVLEANGFKRVKEADIEDYYANPSYFKKRGLPFPG